MEHDPHQFLEGMILAAYALKCRTAYIYIRGEFYHGARDPERGHRGGLREGLPRREHPGIRLLASTSRSTAAPAPTSAARRRA